MKNLEKYEKKYFGPCEIQAIKESQNKTYLGKDKVVLGFTETCPLGKTFDVPLQILETCATEKESDLSKLRTAWIEPLVSQLLTFIVESEVKVEDIQFVISVLNQAIAEAINKSYDVLWKKDRNAVNLMDIENVIKQNAKKENTN